MMVFWAQSAMGRNSSMAVMESAPIAAAIIDSKPVPKLVVTSREIKYQESFTG